MGTRSVISIDKINKTGFYKHYDGYPSATVPSIITYIFLFGYDAFVKECKRISKDGGCSFFFYVSKSSLRNENGLYSMLKTGKLTNKTYNEKEQKLAIDDQEYGYLVLRDKIIIHYVYGGQTKTIKYDFDKLDKRKIFLAIFGENDFNLETYINNTFGVKDDR